MVGSVGRHYAFEPTDPCSIALRADRSLRCFKITGIEVAYALPVFLERVFLELSDLGVGCFGLSSIGFRLRSIGIVGR